MNSVEIIIAAGVVNLSIQLVALVVNYKVIDWRLKQVEHKVTSHDEFADRLTRVEVKVIHLEDRRAGDRDGHATA